MSRTVTVALDGSPESIAAAGWGAREALLHAVPLRLVHVGEQPPHHYVPFAGETVPPPGADRTARLLTEVAATLARRHPGLDIAAEHVSGRPAQALSALARRTPVLVLGSRGLGRAAGYLLGSVAAAVVARAEHPVVLVRADADAAGEHLPDAEGRAAGTGPYRDVVLGLQLRERPSEALLAYAFDAASRRGAALRVVHGSAPDPAGAADELAAGGDGSCAAALRPWREKYPDVEVVEETVIGSAGPHLADASQEASLVVVGRRTRHAAVGPHIGPVLDTLLRHADAPVAVVPHD
ncbi:universal stress protein [Streptomyces sp. NPDC018693]|uniref:universal stress protein n=1 Tax=unclassified Streptomyces TaxID=2593676 RepID=UPI00378959EB